MEGDLFDGKRGVIFAVLAVVLFFGAFYFDVFVRSLIWIVFFLIFGGIYFWDYRIVGRGKYLVSSVVFWLAAIAGVLNIFIEIFPWRVVWLVAVILYVLSGPIAALFRSFSRRQQLQQNI